MGSKVHVTSRRIPTHRSLRSTHPGLETWREVLPLDADYVATVRALSEHVAPGELVTLPGGPPNGLSRVFAGAICPGSGETTPASLGGQTIIQPIR